MLVLKQAPLPEDILTLGVDGINKIWRDAKMRAVGIKRAKTLVEAAEHSVGSKEGAVAARMEIRMLFEDYESRNKRLQEVMDLINELVSQIPMAEKLLEIKGVGIKTVSGFLAEVGDISRFSNPKELPKLAGLALVENSSGKHKGETTISRRGRKRLRYLLFEVAMSLVSKNPEFAELHRYYTTRKINPLKKMQSLMVVAAKLIRVFFVILTKGVDYDPMKMITDIKRPEAYLRAA
jgi:transposase